jgi:hypothetical protein
MIPWIGVATYHESKQLSIVLVDKHFFNNRGFLRSHPVSRRGIPPGRLDFDSTWEHDHDGHHLDHTPGMHAE